MDVKLLGRRIRDYRVKACITQEGLAELTGVSANHIGYIEKGKRCASLDLLDRIAISLHTSVSVLTCPCQVESAAMITDELLVVVSGCSCKEMIVVLNMVVTLIETLREMSEYPES